MERDNKIRRSPSLLIGVSVSLILALALVLWTLLKARRQQGMGKMGKAAEKTKLPGKRRRRLLVAMAGLVAAAGMAAAAGAIIATRRVQPPAGPPAVASTREPLSQGTVFLEESTAIPTPTPAPAQISTPPAPTSQGGDNPSSPENLHPPPEVHPIPENVFALPDLLALRDALAAEIETYREQEGSIDVAIAVTDLQTGEAISVNGNVLHKTGCTINLFALLAAVDAFQKGEAYPDDVAYSISVGVGASYPPEVKRFLQALFGSHQAGVARASLLMGQWGLRSSLFDHVPYYGDGTQNNYLTALETNLALNQLWRGQLFEPQWTQYAIERLHNVQPYLNYILPGNLPASATVAHKIGYHWDYDGWVNDDVGIITFSGDDGQEKAYVITYLSQRATSEYSGYSFGARLSKIVWDYFDAKY